MHIFIKKRVKDDCCGVHVTALAMVVSFLCGLAGQTYATGTIHHPCDTQLVAPRHHATDDATACSKGFDPTGNNRESPLVGYATQKFAFSRASDRLGLQKNAGTCFKADIYADRCATAMNAHRNLLCVRPRHIPLRV